MRRNLYSDNGHERRVMVERRELPVDLFERAASKLRATAQLVDELIEDVRTEESEGERRG